MNDTGDGAEDNTIILQVPQEDRDKNNIVGHVE